VALRKEGGSPIEGFAIYTDITEQKQRKRTLRDREQKTAALYTATEQLVSAHTRQEVAEQIQALVSETFDYPLSGVHFVEDDRLVRRRLRRKCLSESPRFPHRASTGRL